MPVELAEKYQEVLAEVNQEDSQISSSTASSTSEAIVVKGTDEALQQFKLVKVAIGGVVKGYTDLIPGNRYFLALNKEISRQNIISSGDEEYQEVVNNIDQLLAESEELSDDGQVAGEEEVVDNAYEDKLSRTLSFTQPTEEGAYIQTIGIAKSASELLIQPSFNYARYLDGSLQWIFSGGYSTSTAATSTAVGIDDGQTDELTPEQQSVFDNYINSNPGAGYPVSSDTIDEIVNNSDDNQIQDASSTDSTISGEDESSADSTSSEGEVNGSDNNTNNTDDSVQGDIADESVSASDTNADGETSVVTSDSLLNSDNLIFENQDNVSSEQTGDNDVNTDTKSDQGSGI